MRYLYTGADVALTPQNNPDASLGGNVSSTLIGSNVIGNLFSDISLKTLQSFSKETKAIVIENETGLDVVNVKLGYQYPANANFKIEIAVVTLAGGTTMERITSREDTPYNATFQEANIDPAHSIDNSIVIGTIPAGGRYGIWIRRTITTDTSQQVSCPVFTD